MDDKAGLPILVFASPAQWEQWLDEHGASAPGLWLQLAKKGAGVPTVSYAEALDVALCFGWIDGQKAPLDEQFWLQRFTPRGPRSKWSKINVAKVGELERQGRMRPAGQEQVRRARADGRWDAAYDGQRTAAIPPDLREALDADPEAAAFFATLSGANRYAILYRLQDAKKPETRARRLDTFLTMLREHRVLHP